MALASGIRVGPYEILEALGSGGMGVVFRARDARLDRDVAIKALPEAVQADTGRLRRFEQEARAAGSLNHPNLLVVFDVGSHEGTPYLVTELLEGTTLRETLSRSPLPPRRSVDYAVQIARGLAAAHDHGIVHRDVKPENVLITKDGRVKLVDFGLAKAVGPNGKAPAEGTANNTITETGAILGTAGYMSPEQVRGQDVDPQSDIFAFGAVLYEMLTGEQAFGGATPVERGYAILRSEPRHLEPGGLLSANDMGRIVRRCLEKKPEERFHSAHDLAFALEGIVDPTATGERPMVRVEAPPPSIAPSSSRSLRGLLIGAAGVALIVAGVSAVERFLMPAAAPLPVPTTVSATPTLTRVTYRLGSFRNARFSPDAKRVIYDQSTLEEGVRIFETLLGAPSQRPASDERLVLLSVSKSGELAVGRKPPEEMAIRGMMLARQTAGSAPRDLTNSVMAAEWHPDGNQLAITRVTDMGTRLEFPVGKVLFETDGWISAIRFSPSGDAIAFLHHPFEGDDRGTVDLVTMDGTHRVLTDAWWSLNGLAFSPDGDEVWFAAARDSGSRGLSAVTIAGDVRDVYRAPTSLTLLDIDREGRVLVRRDESRTRMIGLVPQSDKPVELTWFDASMPVDLSQDGRLLLFMEGREAAGSEIQVFLRPVNGGPATHLGEGIPLAISPDGRFALITPRAPFNTLTVMPTGAGEPQGLPPGDFANVEAADFFPDGNRFVMAAREPNRPTRLWTQRRDGGAPTPLTEEGVAGYPRVSPDGTRIVARSKDGKVLIVDAETGATTAIDELKPRTRVIQWTNDSRGLYVANSVPLGEPLSTLPVMERFDLTKRKAEPWTRLERLPTVLGMPHRLVVTPNGQTAVIDFEQNFADLYVVDGLR